MGISKTEKQLVLTAKDNASGELKSLQHQITKLQKKATELNEKNLTGFKKLKAQVSSAASALGPYAKGLAAAGAAATVAAAAVAALVKSTAKHNDEIGKMSSRLGTSTEFMSALGFAAELSGKDFGKIGDALTDLNEKMVNSEDKFRKWGIATKKANGDVRSTESVLNDVAERMSHLSSSAERVAMANDLMGGSGRELVPLLQQGAAGLAAMSAEAAKYGAVVSGGAAEDAAAFNDELLKLTTAMSGAGRRVATKIMPALTEAVEGLTEVLVDSAEKFERIEPAVDAYWKGLKFAVEWSGKLVKASTPLISTWASIAEAATSAANAIGLFNDNPLPEAPTKRGGSSGFRSSRLTQQRAGRTSRRTASSSRQLIGSTAMPVDTQTQFGPSIPPSMIKAQQNAARASQDALRKQTELQQQQLQMARESRDAQLQSATAILSAAMTLRSIFSSDTSGLQKVIGAAGLGAQMYLTATGNPAGAALAGQATSAALQFNEGGVVPHTRFSRAGMDSVPALLTPGERILTVAENAAYESRSTGGLTINVSSSIPPDRAAMDRIVRDSYSPSMRRLQRLGAA